MGAKTKELQAAAENTQSTYKEKKKAVALLLEAAEKLAPDAKDQYLKYIPLLEAVDEWEKKQKLDPYNKDIIGKRDQARKIAESQRLIKEASFRKYTEAKAKAEEGERELAKLKQKRDEARKALGDFLEVKGKTNKTLHSIKMKAKRFFGGK